MLHNDPIVAIAPDVAAWRHHMHRHPELGFEEHETARFVAERLRAFGLEVHEGIAGTGVVGTLRSGGGGRAIALRAELDALPIVERSGKPHASQRPGVMHACGHDGHAAILIGAARLLSERRSFDGIVHFVFQPAEEALGGARRMIEACLLERFPVEMMFALHNWPGLPVGVVATRAGAMMAAVDDFDLSFTGTGSHAAMPHLGDDPVLAAAAFITAAQRIVSRTVDPQTPLVVSITQIHGGGISNIVPSEVRLQGTCRFFEPSLSEHCRRMIHDIAQSTAAAHGVAATLDYRPGYPPVINTAEAAAAAAAAARSAVGPEHVLTDFKPSMGCEDFAYMVEAAGGAYAWIGAGEAPPGYGLHGDRFDFNDAIIPTALRYWTALVQQVLPLSTGALAHRDISA